MNTKGTTKIIGIGSYLDSNYNIDPLQDAECDELALQSIST